MMRRFVFTLACFGLTTCCPTLWLKMTKTEPSPWPEVPAPKAGAPVAPADMPNRFDVLEHGELTRRADGYRDELDDREDWQSQQIAALSALDQIIERYDEKPSERCAFTLRATVKCTQPALTGPRANCNALIINDALPADRPGMVIVKGQARTVVTVSHEPVTNEPLIALEPDLDAAPSEIVQACFLTKVVLATPLLSFVHMSDIQLRDPSVVLTDRRLSKRLDWFGPLSSFEYDEDLAFYNQYVLESMVATINAAAAPASQRNFSRPSFVIHTGDSIDAGVMSELRRFHRVIDRLQIPFFEVFGNHDVLAFGNLTPTDEVAQANDRKCSPVSALLGAETAWAPNKICVDARVSPCKNCTASDVELVASVNGHDDTRQRFMTELEHTPSQPVAEPLGSETDAYCDDTQPKVWKNAYTRVHGFDLGTADGTLEGKRLGYYAFVEPMVDGRKAVFVALDSEELEDHHGGTGGHLRHAQLQWLQSVLACVKRPDHAHDLVFVFAHQPLSEITVDNVDAGMDLEATLRSSDNVAGYLFGHYHRNDICGDHRHDKNDKPLTCTRFWEIQTASLVEFPQEARLVRIKQVSQHLGFLEVSTFHEQLTEPDSQMASYVRLARRGAERDHCAKTDARCSADRRPYRDDGNSTSARLFFRMP